MLTQIRTRVCFILFWIYYRQVFYLCASRVVCKKNTKVMVDQNQSQTFMVPIFSHIWSHSHTPYPHRSACPGFSVFYLIYRSLFFSALLEGCQAIAGALLVDHSVAGGWGGGFMTLCWRGFMGSKCGAVDVCRFEEGGGGVKWGFLFVCLFWNRIRWLADGDSKNSLLIK